MNETSFKRMLPLNHTRPIPQVEAPQKKTISV